jgi:hypothetical protein
MFVGRIALVLAFALGSTQVSRAQDSAHPLDRKAMQDANNLAHEHMICAAFAAIVSGCMILRDKTDPVGKRYEEVGAALTDRGLRIGEVGGVSRKASEARLEMAYEDMMEKIEHSCANISVLLQKHMKACVALHNEGPDRLRAIVTRTK